MACRRFGPSGGGLAAPARLPENHQQAAARKFLEEKEEAPAGAGDKWREFVTFVQRLWDTGDIPQQVGWTVVVLLPKGGGDYRGIGLLEPVWKAIEILMDDRLKRIPLHDCLHGFTSARGTGTAMLEVPMVLTRA